MKQGISSAQSEVDVYRSFLKEENKYSEEVNSLARETNNASKQLNNTIRAANESFPEIVFQQPPIVNVLVDNEFKLYSLKEKIISKGLQEDKLSDFVEQPFLVEYKINGISLLDIANMQPDPETGLLDVNDVSSIARMFSLASHSYPILQKLRNRENVSIEKSIFNYLIIYPAQSQLEPFKFQSSSILTNKFRRNINAFYDFNAAFLLNEVKIPSVFDVKKSTLLSVPSGRSVAGLSCYLPARLGLTPASTIKLIIEKYNISASLISILKNNLLLLYKPEISKAYRVNSLRDEFEKFQLYDEESDIRITNDLEEYYSDSSRNSQNNDNLYEEYQSQVNAIKEGGFDLIKKKVIHRSRKLKYNLSDNHIIKDINVTFSEYNDKVLIFLLNIGQSVLTIEFDREGRIFGIPYELKEKISGINELLTVELLKPLTNEFIEKYKSVSTSSLVAKAVLPRQEIQLLKSIEDVRNQRATDIETEETKDDYKEMYYERKEKQKRDEEFRNRKRRNNENTYTNSRIEPTTDNENPLPTYTEKVYYRKRDIEKWLGNKALNEKVTEKCIEEIKRFSNGEKTEIAKLAEYDDIYRLRVQLGRDKMRIILRETDNHVFEVIDLIPQKDDGKNSYAGY